MELLPLSTYAREVRPQLPAHVFEPEPGRLAWLALHVAIAGAGIALIGMGIGGVALAAPLAIAIGVAFAGMTFVAHEALHGAVVRGRRLRSLVGGLAFLPFAISPRHWSAWHNRMHHGNTGAVSRDPDAYPTLADYHSSPGLRLVDRFSFGSGQALGVLTLLVGLSVQSLQVLLGAGPRARYLGRRDYLLALGETAIGVAFWGAIAWWLGPLGFLFAWVIPIAIGNAIVIAHILTNHSLSPHTDINDPLINSLSVTAPRWFERYTLNFGLHVEHHLFPAMSSRHAPAVRAVLQARWPERYHSMPLPTALVALFRTGRIYKTATTLIAPRSGRESATLGAGADWALNTPELSTGGHQALASNA